MKTLALARVSASACTSPSEGSPVHRMAYTSHPQFLWDFTRNRAEGNAAARDTAWKDYAQKTPLSAELLKLGEGIPLS